MNLDVVELSRLQFAVTIMFHYLFPPLTIGLGVLMAFMEGMYLKTGDRQYESMARFWTRIFGVNFAVGVATGIVMEFQFGTNWATYSRFVGDVFGAALAAEGIFAFFLESGFLAVLLFGWDKVSPRVHFFSTLMVSLGSIFSAIWIVVANSWQQTPAGHRIVNAGTPSAHAVMDNFWEVLFNPSSMHRLNHVLLGAFIMGAFFVMSVSAYYILKNRHLNFARKSFTIALMLGLASSLLILLSGHAQAQMVAVQQPAKLAAFEGIFKTEEGTPLRLFGVPDSQRGEVACDLSVPGGLSFLVHGNFTQPVPGLDQIKPEDWPPVGVSFQSYHTMVASGMFFITLTLLGTLFWFRGTLFEKRWLMWIFVFAVIVPVVANQLGWVAAEVGRQPWIVYGLLRTSQAYSKTLSAGQVATSIVFFFLIYGLLLAVWFYVVDHKIREGPEDELQMPERTTAAGLVQAAATLPNPAGPSMTEAKE